MLILLDFYCPNCDHDFEDYVQSDNRVTKCTECGEDAKQRCSSAIGTVGKPGDAHFQEVMRKRSHDHSVSEARRNPERLAKQFGGTPAVQQPWNLRSSKKSSTKD